MELTKNTTLTDNGRSSGMFTPKDALSEFDAGFLYEESCRAWVLYKLHGIKMNCPGCRTELPYNKTRSFWDCRRIKCDRCGKYFTALTDTFLSGAHFNFREIVLLSLLIALGVADKQIAAILKISTENVRLWRHRFESIAQAQKISSGERNGN